jgi:hypothetical protein
LFIAKVARHKRGIMLAKFPKPIVQRSAAEGNGISQSGGDPIMHVFNALKDEIMTNYSVTHETSLAA